MESDEGKTESFHEDNFARFPMMLSFRKVFQEGFLLPEWK